MLRHLHLAQSRPDRARDPGLLVCIVAFSTTVLLIATHAAAFA
ncbi:hypothetical protein [Sphingomonas sp. CFBP 13714]|nr:hypothetical protein [Sphingomonas sp. CFBP 13714]